MSGYDTEAAANRYARMLADAVSGLDLEATAARSAGDHDVAGQFHRARAYVVAAHVMLVGMEVDARRVRERAGAVIDIRSRLSERLRSALTGGGQQ